MSGSVLYISKARPGLSFPCTENELACALQGPRLAPEAAGSGDSASLTPRQAVTTLYMARGLHTLGRGVYSSTVLLLQNQNASVINLAVFPVPSSVLVCKLYTKTYFISTATISGPVPVSLLDSMCLSFPQDDQLWHLRCIPVTKIETLPNRART